MIPKFFFDSPYVTLDTETTGLLPHRGDRPFAVSMTTYEGEDFYVRWEVDPFTRKVRYNKEELEEIVGFLDYRSKAGLKTIFHNASFDLAMLFSAMQDVATGKVSVASWCNLKGILDTVILAHAANSARESFKLKPLCEQILGISTADQADLQESVIKARREGKTKGYLLAKDVEADYHLGDVLLCSKYAILDTKRTMGLLKAFLPLLEQKAGPFSQLKPIVEMEHKLQMAVLEMNLRGVRVDPSRIAELKEYYSGVIAENTKIMGELGFADLNPKSPKQKKEVFYEQLGYTPEVRKRKGKDGSKKQTTSVDKTALAKFAATSPLAECLLNISEAQHQLNSFILPFEREAVPWLGYSYLYPNFNSVGPRTGRLSCSRPNLQNITSATSPMHKTKVELLARECFIPRPNCAWMLADYAQVEIWVAAFLSKDPVMCEILLAGNSVHDMTCDKVFGHKSDFVTNRASYRKMAKILTFSILYGSGPKALAELLSITYEEAKVYYTNFWNTYSGLRKYADSLADKVKKGGFVKDAFGRVFFLNKNLAYKALNYIIQGTAAGILKRAHLAVFELLKEKYQFSKVILSIHDELVIEGLLEGLCTSFVDEVAQAMSGDFHKLLGMPKPFKVEFSFVTKNWGKKASYT